MQLKGDLKVKEERILELCKEVEDQKARIANLENEVAEYHYRLTEAAAEPVQNVHMSSLLDKLAQTDSESFSTVRSWLSSQSRSRH